VSDIGTILAAGLSSLSTLKGDSLGYRISTSGSFTALTGWCLHQARVDEPIFDESSNAEIQNRTAILKGPISPVMAKGYQIYDYVTSLTWAVESAKLDVQQVCSLKLQVTIKRTPDRQGAA